MTLDEIDDADILEEYERMAEENKPIRIKFPAKRDEKGRVIR